MSTHDSLAAVNALEAGDTSGEVRDKKGLSMFGDMKGSADVFGGKLAWLDMNLRGASQVVFMNNPVSGIIIIIALAVFDWKFALYGIVSLLAGTTTAMILHRHGYEGYETLTDGLYGFNAILVGLAIATFCEDAKSPDIGHVCQTVFFCALFGILSSVVMNALAKWMPTPAFTIPFNVSIMWFFAGSLAYSHVKTDLSPHLPVATSAARACLRSSPLGACDMNNFNGFLTAALEGVCEIYLAGSNWSAVLILLGMALCSPLASFCSLMGSVVGVATGMALGVDGYTLFKGLYGFNPALTAIAVGGGIFAPPSWKSFGWAMFGAVVSTFMNGALVSLLSPAGVPAFTLPFCVAAVFHIGAGLHK